MKKITILLTLCLPLLFSGCVKAISDYNVSIYGTVIDSKTYEPIQGALITIIPSSKSCYSGLDGYFEFEDLLVQKYTITAQKDGYITDRKTVNLMAGEKQELTFALKKEY